MHHQLPFLDEENNYENDNDDDDPYLIHDLESFMERHPFKIEENLATFEDFIEDVSSINLN